MRVRMLTTAAGPDGVYMAGETWDAPSAFAIALIVAGAAVDVDGASTDAVEVETAVLTPAEIADVRPRGAKRTPATK